MFETGIRQFRMAMSMVWGRPFDPENLARLVADAVSTVKEFGELGSDAREIIDTPYTDVDDRTDQADRALRRTARRLAKRSAFYARRFAAAGLDPDALSTRTLRELPVTVKADLVERQSDFVCAGSEPFLASRTTGTSGRAAEIWMSRYELGVWSGFSALSGLLHDELRPEDLMQVHVSSRATAAVHLTAATCRLVGASCRVLGVVPPDQALDTAVGSATLLSASPSYLAELVVAARRRGLSPADFRLRRIDVGGEILSSSVRAAAEQTFGAPVRDSFGMTEVIPVTATTCSQEHLHHDLTMGHVEVLDLVTGSPARPGALGTVVITPYHPYRECMPVFRYDTRDVVATLTDETLSCELAGLPGTSRIVGKPEQVLTVGSGRAVTPRDLVEAVESLPTRPWPARYGAASVGGQLVLTLPVSAVAGLAVDDLSDHFAGLGVEPVVRVVDDAEAGRLRPVRSDLHELTFATASSGADRATD